MLPGFIFGNIHRASSRHVLARPSWDTAGCRSGYPIRLSKPKPLPFGFILHGNRDTEPTVVQPCAANQRAGAVGAGGRPSLFGAAWAVPLGAGVVAARLRGGRGLIRVN